MCIGHERATEIKNENRQENMYFDLESLEQREPTREEKTMYEVVKGSKEKKKKCRLKEVMICELKKEIKKLVCTC